MLAALALGAQGVQVGSRFAASLESSAHDRFKQRITSAGEGDTVLTLKKLTPVRLIKNKFYADVLQAEDRGASPDELRELLGSRRSKLGIFEGDLDEGELEIGQVAAGIEQVQPAADILKDIWNGFQTARKTLCNEIC